MFELRRGRGCVNLDPPGDGAPVVSVIIPVHNGGRWVGEAMDSILGQTLSELELLMVDDGSTDDSVAQIESRAAQDARVRLFRQSHAGAAAALNLALASARTPLMARLDADDVAHTSRLERQVAFLAEHPEVGAVGAWAIDIDAKGRLRGRRQPETDPQVLRQLLLRRNPFIHSAVTARTDIVRRVGGYRRAFDIAEDYDLWLRVAEVSDLANVPEFLVSYRVHDLGSGARSPLRQAFSARLARRSAMARRQTGVDPAAGLDAPPDWRTSSDPDVFYAEDAALYRWLDGLRRNDDSPARALRGLLDEAFELTHTERRLAAQAIWARVRSVDRSEAADARKVLLQLCRLRPSAVVRAAWSLRA
jgi:GT2 family glycosyltransferase